MFPALGSIPRIAKQQQPKPQKAKRKKMIRN
jgi:hypothetical protein